MGKFKITDHESGKTVVVSGDAPPSDQEAEQIFTDAGLRDHAQQAAPQAAPQPPHGALDTAVDVARSVPGGIAKGVSAIAGLPGDLNAGLNGVADWALNKVDPETVKKMQAERTAPHSIPSPPTSGEVLGAVSKPVGGMYEPKTTAGQYAETVSSFAPNAIAPGSMVQRAGRVLLPGLVSEEAGQQTKGTKWEPVARTVGALAGGVGQGIAESAGHARANPVPSGGDLKKAAGDIYTKARSAGVTIDPSAYDGLVSDVGAAVKQAGTHPKLHPKVAGALESLEEAKTGQPLDLEELERLRRIANGAAKSIEPDERRVAGVIVDKIDDFMDNLGPTQVSSGNPQAAGTLSEARGLWSKMRKSETINDAIERANSTALAQNGNKAGALRSQFQAIAKNKKVMRTFSPTEQDAIKGVARVGVLTGPLAAIGALRPRGLVALGEAGAGAMHPETMPHMLGAAVGGQAAQMALNGMTSRNARLASELMRSGQTNPGATSLPRNLVLSTLLAQGSH